MISPKTNDPLLFNDTITQQLQLVNDLKHIIHYIAVLLRVLQWKHPKRVYSLTLLCALVLHSTLYKCVLYSAPALFAILKIYNYYNREINGQTRRTSSQYSLTDDLTEIRNKVQWVTAATDWIQQEINTAYRVYYRKYLSISSAKQRSIICLGVSCLFALSYAGWLILLQQIDLFFLLLMIMCVYCPWVHPIQTALVRAAMLFYTSTTTTTTDIKKTRTPANADDKRGEICITGYCFEIYHNQRWWFPTGWSNLLLPQDRPVWSDVYSEGTPSIYDFQLPPSVNIGKPNQYNQQKIASWTWMDPNWSKQQDDSTDSAGWQYGNWQWKNWSSRSSGYTRRRKWYRYAQRVESWVDLVATKETKDSLIEDTSSSSSAPSSIFDENSSATSSISYITASAPIFTSSSSKNKGERMLRRHSAGKSISFNMTIPELCSNSPDDMYKSPRHHKFKRFSI